ncbi:MAG: PASTA domain-containing protein [Actinobacteria bacterium]|nr:PASTA domain-containing protein [Actinomycetota bacterium]
MTPVSLSRIVLRPMCLVAVALAVGVVAGCGGDDRPPAPPSEHVRLEIAAPSDGSTLRRGTADVRGSVSPRASSVTVLGRPALVSDGRFTVVVPLEPGVNVIDVIATAPRRLPTLTALRVTRDVLVTVPDLTDLPEDEVEARLEPLGLEAQVERGGGLFDVLRPGEPVVCEQEPEAGARVRRGREVVVVVAVRCG